MNHTPRTLMSHISPSRSIIYTPSTSSTLTMATTTTIITPYHPPTTPSSIHHVALTSKSFRVFGLNDPAWRNARKDWKKYKSSGGGHTTVVSAINTTIGGSGDDDTSDSDDEEEDGNDVNQHGGGSKEEEEEEEEEMALICNAITTALAEDAGGFGTAGFHATKVDKVQLLTNLNNIDPSSAVYNAKLIIPHDSSSSEDNKASNNTLLLPIDETEKVKYSGNDEFYLKCRQQQQQTEEGEGGGEGGGKQSSTTPQFQLRITISRAREGLAAKKYYEALFAKRKEMSQSDGEAADATTTTTTTDNFNNIDQWVEEDEHLKQLQQDLIDAKEERRHHHHHGGGGGANNTNGNNTNKEEEEGSPKEALGYYIEIMLVEPHVKENEVVIAPPSELDKSHPLAKLSSGCSTLTREEEEVEQHCNNNIEGGGTTTPGKSIFERNVYSSRQFSAPGPWEKANIKSYGDIGLDVRKALVRVEFPVFPEGCKEKTFRETYQLNARLKSGSFATVCRGTHRATGKKIAVKCVLRKDLPPSDDAAIYDEVLILSTLRHSYICPLIDFFEERECYFLIMELMSGGDLFDRIGKLKSYNENDARDLCRKMLESVRYCHENSVAHCDMKPKNLLLVSEEDDVQMKLADFGFATRVYEPRSLTKQCGTPFFVAPEVLLRSNYDQQSDMWSCGVIMFLLLGGDLPFMGRSQRDLFRNIVMGKYEFQEEGWAHVSEEAKDLVKKLLVTDPSIRLSSRDAMASPWMRQRRTMLAKNNLQFTSQRLKGFNARMKLRASMIAVSSVVSLRMSVKGLRASNSNLSVASNASNENESKDESKAPKRPSFLDLPMEETPDDEEEEEDRAGKPDDEEEK